MVCRHYSSALGWVTVVSEDSRLLGCTRVPVIVSHSPGPSASPDTCLILEELICFQGAWSFPGKVEGEGASVWPGVDSQNHQQ